MILVDVNLLVYATRERAPEHPRARDWLDGCLGGHARVGIPWSSLLGFLRVTTNPRSAAPPQPTAAAWANIQAWLDRPNVWTPEPGDRYRAILDHILAATNVSGNLIPDAALAALALEHGLELCSTDGDFARFPGLRWTNPLASQMPLLKK